MKQKILITTNGIKSVLKKYNYCQALAEYVWNGFDAKATEVKISFESNAIGTLSSIKIVDNGYGIPQNKLEDKFAPFYESEKWIDSQTSKNNSVLHGKNGIGRLTFFTFAEKAVWNTTYKDENKVVYNYQINIDSDKLDQYINGKIISVNNKTKCGTEVVFTNIQTINQYSIENEFKTFLKCEFAWFLELNKHKEFKIYIGKELLEYNDIIGDSEDKKFLYKETNTEFLIHYIRWNSRLNEEYSRYYYLDSLGDEKWKEYTLLNNKGDSYFHSVYIKSSYFDNFNFKTIENQKALIGGTRADEEFKYIQNELANYLRKKRKPFLKKYSEKLIKEYEEEKVFPEFKNEPWDKLKKEDLKNVVRGLYEVQPKIFTTLNLEQKKTFVGFLNLILDSDEREKVLNIIREVVDLDSSERADLVKLLKTTTLSNIIKTTQLIEERYRIISQLKDLVLSPILKANERDHLQKFIEDHFWVFGEKYHLISAAEPKFEEALRRYIKYLRGEDKVIKIVHPDKQKEMDIFMCRQNPLINTVENVVIELKSPTIKLGEKELSQVKKYMGVILEQPDFNANNYCWEFYLIGNDFDTSKYLDREIENSKQHGERSLVFKSDNYKIYVKKWSEIFNEFECRHSFLNKKLQLQREKLSDTYINADEIIKKSKKSVASL